MGEIRRYPHLIFFSASIAAAIVLLQIDAVPALLFQTEKFGYFGAFAAGVMFSSAFTSAIATVIFYHLGATSIDPMLASIVGGAGAAATDTLLYRWFRDGVFEEVKHFFVSHRIIRRNPIRPPGKWTRIAAFVFGIAAIMSPLPDEFGVAALAYYGHGTKRRVPIPLFFLLNIIGIYIVIKLGGA